MIACPLCHSENTAVTGAHFRKQTQLWMRYRVCKKCDNRFSTYEVLVEEWDQFLALRAGMKLLIDSITKDPR